jgi:hypothetical protein
VAPKRVVCIVVVGVTLAVTGCDDGKTRYGDSDFVWGFGVNNAESLKQALLSFHMAETDADCAVSTIFTPELEPDSTSGATYAITADLLETAIEECNIDTSRIWRSWD